MKTVINNIYKPLFLYGFLIVLLFKPGTNYAAAVTADSLKLKVDSVNNKIYPDSDSTTFLFQFYQKNLLGEPALFYKYLGGIVNYRMSFGVDLLSGLENYYPLLYVQMMPVAASSYSYIKYLSGTKTEQIFCAGFSQKVFKRFLLEGDYRSIVSPGFFQNQSSNIKNYAAGLAYQNLKNNYHAAAGFVYSKIQSEQNGGLKIDSSLENIAKDNNQGSGLSINLADAKVVIKRRYFGLEQSINFLGNVNDTLASRNNYFSLNQISHSIQYDKKYYIYSSNTINKDYYLNSFFDSISTYDSLFISRLINSLTFTFNAGRGKNGTKLELYYRNELIDYNQTAKKNGFMIHHAGAGYYYLSDQFNGYTRFEYRFEKELNDIFNVVIHLDKKFISILNSAFTEFEYKTTYPSLISTTYSSNHFIWENKLQNVKSGKITAGLTSRNNIFKLTFSAENLHDYIYYNTQAMPAQYSGQLTLLSSKINVRYNFYNNWNFYNESYFQGSDNNSIYTVPDFTSYTSVYYERNFFKKAMKASIGAGCLYFSSYYADAFMPATSQFYLQNKQKVGNYPYIDLFTNFKIKSAKFFIKIEHLNMGIGKALYFYAPHQPTPGRTLKVGIDWNFPEDLRK